MAPPTLILGGYSIGKVRFVNEVEVLDPRSIGNPVLADGYTDTLGIMCDYYLGSECVHLSLAFFLEARGENNEVEGLGMQQQCRQTGSAPLKRWETLLLKIAGKPKMLISMLSAKCFLNTFS